MNEYLPAVPRSKSDPLMQIRADLNPFPAAQSQVAKVFLDDPDWSIRANVGEIARLVEVSVPKVIRFCLALDFDGLSDFKLHLAQSLAVGTPVLHRAISGNDSVARIIHKILAGAAALLTNLKNQLDASVIVAAIDKLAAGRRVECYSVGSTSTFLADEVQALFSRLGLMSNAYFGAHPQLISASALSSQDVVLAIYRVGRMPTLLEAVDVAREQAATIIGVTQSNRSLAKRSAIPISVDVPGKRSRAGRNGGVSCRSSPYRGAYGGCRTTSWPSGNRSPEACPRRLVRVRSGQRCPPSTEVRLVETGAGCGKS